MAAAEAPLGKSGVCERLRDASKKALIIVDVQNDFCEGGALAVPDGSAVIPIINELRSRREWAGVFLTQDWHPVSHASFASNNEGATLFTLRELPGMGMQMMWPNHCVQETPGAEFHTELLRSPRDVVVRKGKNPKVDSYSGFGDAHGHTLERTELADRLQDAGITDLFVCGLALDYCVSFTCKDAAKAGFNTFCVLDGSRGIAPDSIAAELAAMREVGVHLIHAADVPTAEEEAALREGARAAAARGESAGAREGAPAAGSGPG